MRSDRRRRQTRLDGGTPSAPNGTGATIGERWKCSKAASCWPATPAWRLAQLDQPADVNHDNRVTPFDALLVINDLSRPWLRTRCPAAGASPLAAAVAATAAPRPSPRYVDVNGDNRVSPIDCAQRDQLVGRRQVACKSPRLRPIWPARRSRSISAGSDFLLQTIVQDVRSPASTISGVFAAFLNVSYDSGPGLDFAQRDVQLRSVLLGRAHVRYLSTPGLISGSRAASAVADRRRAMRRKSCGPCWSTPRPAESRRSRPASTTPPATTVLLYGVNDRDRRQTASISSARR